MKKIILTIAAVVSLTGCLKEKVLSYATPDNYYTSVVEIKTGLNGCYNPLRTILGARGFWEMTEMDADLLYINGSTYYDASCNISPAQPGIGRYVWQYGYSGVQRTNEMIYSISRAVQKGYIKERESLPLMGEAAILRALYYYYLTATFGDVPFYVERVTEANRAKIATLPRMSAAATRDYCIDELKDLLLVKKVLPMTRTYDNGTEYRMGAAVGLMVAAKMCMWNHRWVDAVELIDALENIYGHYASTPEKFAADYPLTDIPFSVKYVRESILELGNAVKPYGIQTTALIASVSTPPRGNIPTEYGIVPDGDEQEQEAAEGSDFYCGIAIPELGGYAHCNTSARPTVYLYKQLLPYGTEDLRAYEYESNEKDPLRPRRSSGTLAWCWVGYDLQNDPGRENLKSMFFWSSATSGSRISSAACPWLGNKFWAYGMYNTKDPNNYKIFRFADALLMKAEALLMLRRYDEACDYLAITRKRAGYSVKLTFNAVGGDEDALMEEIRKERAKELVGEFQRKFDLVRWGIWYDRTNTYNEGQYIHDYIRPCHKYWPIPGDQVSYSGGALDNNEYME